MKKCIKCKDVKELTEFNIAKANKDGYIGTCKSCLKVYRKLYYINNKEYLDSNSKLNYYKDHKETLRKAGDYRKANKQKIKKINKEYYQNNKTIIKSKQKLYQDKNRIKRKEKAKEYRKNNKEKIKLQAKKFRDKHNERLKQERKEYYQNNKERAVDYVKQRKLLNPLFKMRCNISTRTANAFKKKSWKKNGTQKLLGCSFKVAFNHLESQFTEGMTWENHGDWHIDHIVPLSIATTEEELIELCHYSNLQPLWAEDNLIKGNSL